MGQMTTLYEEGSWLMERDDLDRNRIRLKHTCGQQTVFRRKYSKFEFLRDPGHPCGYCRSVCPVGLQGLYNLLEVV